MNMAYPLNFCNYLATCRQLVIGVFETLNTLFA